MTDDSKRLWNRHELSCEHGAYLTLGIAVVDKAREDVAAGMKVFKNWGDYATGAVIRQAAISWRWLSDPTIVCQRLSFSEICDACGIDHDRALDEVDAMAESFPPGFLRHIERLIRLVDAEPPRKAKKPKQRKEAGDVGSQQKEGRVRADRERRDRHGGGDSRRQGSSGVHGTGRHPDSSRGSVAADQGAGT